MSLSESFSNELTGPVVSYRSPVEIDIVERLSEALTGLASIEEVRQAENKRHSAIIFKGKLLGDAEALYPVISERFKSLGYTAMLQRQGQADVIAAVEGLLTARSVASPAWVHALLLFVTIITTTLSGAAFQGYRLDVVLREIFIAQNYGFIWTVFQAGAPFSLTLLLILGTHEMGHYIAARRHGVAVTLPYFIPLPFIGILGTLGAVIFIRSALSNRKALFDVGISGPLAGFVVALIAFVIGLMMPRASNSNLAFFQTFHALGFFRGLGMPLMLQWIGAVVKPHTNLSGFIINQPVALAAWFGMLLTVLNLLPIGQLDGGHVMYTLFGRFAWVIALVTFGVMIFLGLTDPLRSSLLVYALLVLLTGLRHPAPGNDITPLDWPRRLLGYGTILLFFLIATATPFIIQYR